MNIRPRSFSVLYGIQRFFLNFFYLISIVAVFWLIFFVLDEVLSAGGTVIILVSIAYLVLVILGYSLLQVISYIPANLAGAFDPIKNGIADRSIESGGKLALEIAEFLCTFFDFAFFDIESSVVVLEGQEPGYSTDEKLRGIDLVRIGEFIGDRHETLPYRGGKAVDGHLYVIPLIFGNTRLGFIVVLTRRRLRKVFIRLLDELENDFLDDQVLHVLARENSILS